MPIVIEKQLFILEYGRKDDLKNQIEFLLNFTSSKRIIADETIEDIGSGLNYNRKKME